MLRQSLRVSRHCLPTKSNTPLRAIIDQKILSRDARLLGISLMCQTCFVPPQSQSQWHHSSHHNQQFGSQRFQSGEYRFLSSSPLPEKRKIEERGDVEKNSSSNSFKAPLYLLPPAYRKRDPNDIGGSGGGRGRERGGRGGRGDRGRWDHRDRNSSAPRHSRRGTSQSHGRSSLRSNNSSSSHSPMRLGRRRQKRNRLPLPIGSARRIKSPAFASATMRDSLNDQQNKQNGRYGSRGANLDDLLNGIKFNVLQMALLEKSLGLKMNEYTNQLSGCVRNSNTTGEESGSEGGKSNVYVLDFGSYAEMTKEKEEEERIPTPKPSFSILDTLDKPQESTNVQPSHPQSSDPTIESLLSTEESYSTIAEDFQTLVNGWCEISEMMCNARRLDNFDSSQMFESSQDNTPDDKLVAVSVKDYEDSLAHAEHHLELFETVFRNRVNALENQNLHFNEEILQKNQDASAGGGGTQVLGKVKSLFWGGVFSSNEHSLASPISEETSPSNVGKIHAHNQKKPEISFYEQILSANQSSYCFGKEAKKSAAQRSNRLLNRWITLQCLARPSGNNSNGKKSSQFALSSPADVLQYDVQFPEQRLFHITMRQNSELESLEDVQQTEEWLRRMRSLHSSGYSSCAPDVHAYNLVLLAYRNLCAVINSSFGGRGRLSTSNPGGKKKEMSTYCQENLQKLRTEIVEGTERIVSEMRQTEQSFQSKSLVEPNGLTLNLALSSFARAGDNSIPDLCQKTDRLLQSLIGPEQFENLILNPGLGENPSVESQAISGKNEDDGDSWQQVEDYLRVPKSDYTSPDMDTYHWIVNIYSCSGDTVYVSRSVNLLKKMITMRNEADTDSGSGRSQNSVATAPFTGTFNTVLRALQRKTYDDELKNRDIIEENINISDSTLSHTSSTLTDIAKDATAFLDSMVQYEVSLPSRVTYMYLLQLWSKTGSPEAGKCAEEILCRMEIMNLCHDEIESFSNAYFLALQCWITAARAGEVGAAERAFRLLEVVEAQWPHKRRFWETSDGWDGVDNPPGDDVFDRHLQLNKSFFTSVMTVCTLAKEERDVRKAAAIAFELYEKMEERGMTPSRKFVEMMYTCVCNYLDRYPYDGMKYLPRVLECASQHGLSQKELKAKHNQSLQKVCN